MKYRYRSYEMQSLGRVSAAYGLLAEEYEDGQWRSVAVIPDVSQDQLFVDRLAEKCTREELSPDHLLDVVLDALP